VQFLTPKNPPHSNPLGREVREREEGVRNHVDGGRKRRGKGKRGRKEKGCYTLPPSTSTPPSLPTGTSSPRTLMY